MPENSSPAHVQPDMESQRPGTGTRFQNWPHSQYKFPLTPLQTSDCPGFGVSSKPGPLTVQSQKTAMKPLRENVSFESVF